MAHVLANTQNLKQPNSQKQRVAEWSQRLTGKKTTVAKGAKSALSHSLFETLGKTVSKGKISISYVSTLLGG